MIKICPHCGARYSVMPHVGDFVHDCNIPTAEDVKKKEDVVRTQNWTDSDGSGKMLGPTEFMMQGIGNTVWGQRAHIEGEDIENLTLRGQRKSTHRSRRHFEYINLENG